MGANPFLQALKSGRVLTLDGAMGTMLQAAGMPPETGPIEFCLARPDILLRIHKEYIEAGCDIITTCTFGANQFKLAKGKNVFEINRQLAEIARKAADAASRPILVAGDVGPTGLFAKPLGKVEPREMLEAFQEQIKGLAAGGVDLVFMETQFDLGETRLARAAARSTGLPAMVSMTFEKGVSLTGSTPEIFAETMQNMDCAAIGSNCSLGPVEMAPVIEELVSVCACPVMAEPNAGIPVLRNGKTIFPLGPEEFAEKTAAFVKMGAQIVGGCCGTTPAHIAALVRSVQNLAPHPPRPENAGVICLTSRQRLVRIGKNQPIVLIGERINPTGKPALAEGLASDNFSLALSLADAQIKAGAAVLDVNTGAPMVDETRVLPELTSLLVERVQAPLSLDSSSMLAIKRALAYSPGSFLVNSINGEAGRMAELGPLCRDFGAPFILLPIKGKNLPILASERIAIIESLIAEALALGIPRRLIMVDILAMTISATPEAARECLKMAAWCKETDLPSTIGLSNISFGMPARMLLNSTFLGLARGAGLSSCIANPDAAAIREACAALAALEDGEKAVSSFASAYAAWKPGNQAPVKTAAPVRADNLYEMVLLGDKANIAAAVEKEIANGADPLALVNGALIPAINEVGELFEKREYFLPQLICSAEAMQKAFAILRPLLEAKSGPEKKPVIVMATVEGDVHDIGKNIVSLLLGNHGFEIIDAGKDVPATQIVDLAEKSGAAIIGLSALMTTTMPRMADTVSLVKQKGLPIKIMVGGAAVTPDFARLVGADAYCDDAVDSVKAARKFTGLAD